MVVGKPLLSKRDTVKKCEMKKRKGNEKNDEEMRDDEHNQLHILALLLIYYYIFFIYHCFSSSSSFFFYIISLLSSYFTTAACIQENWQQTSHQTVLLERFVHLVLVVWRLCSSVRDRKSVDSPDDFRYDESVDDKWYFLGSRRLYIVKAGSYTTQTNNAILSHFTTYCAIFAKFVQENDR